MANQLDFSQRKLARGIARMRLDGSDGDVWRAGVDDVEAALAKGDLKFSLDGYKLNGSWVLVRTRGYARSGQEREPHESFGKTDGKSWLLIKHRDFWSGPVDIAEFAPLSVKSGEDFAHILAADEPAEWRTHRPVVGGETGAMLQDVIDEAARLRAGRRRPSRSSARKIVGRSNGRAFTSGALCGFGQRTMSPCWHAGASRFFR